MALFGFVAMSIQVSLSEDKVSLSKALLRQGITLYEAGQMSEATEKFREAIKLNKKLADAYNYLALILMEEGTVHSRFLATIELDKALKLDWDNPDFRFTNGVLYLKKSMSGSALREFKKVVDEDPRNFKAYYQMGLIEENDMMRYRDMVDPDEGGIIFFREFAEKNKEKATYYFNKAIAINPMFTELYYRLGLIYFEFDDLDEMIRLLEKAVIINPKDKNCHLFLGFAYHQSQKYELAEREYEDAMKLMAADELTLFQSIDMIMSPGEKKEYDSISSRRKNNFTDMFWKRNDPFYLTPYNERRLEHYSRIAYANLRYSDPDKNIEGWKTDQGKVYIRYGKPIHSYRTRPEIGDVTTANSFGPVNSSKDVWLYDDFQFVFDDPFLSNRYEFAWGDRPENDYRSVYEQLIQKTPELHRYLPEKKILNIAMDIAEFRGQAGNTALNISYAVPADSIYLLQRDGIWQSRMQKGLFLFDDDWREVYGSRAEISLPERSIQKVGEDKYFIDRSEIETKPDSFTLAFEIHDLESGKRGSLRSKVGVSAFNDPNLTMSDILLAYDINLDQDVSRLSRMDLDMVANPLQRYAYPSPVYIYYEIYNLKQDENKETSFRIEYTLGDQKRKASALKRLLSGLKLIRLTGDITTSVEYEGNVSTEHQVQRIDLSPSHRGQLKLTVTVTDLNDNQHVFRELDFKLD